MMLNSDKIPRSERLNEATSKREHEELLRRKQIYLEDLKKRAVRLRELKKQEKQKKAESIKEQELKKLEELRKLQSIGKIAAQKKQELKDIRNEKQKLYREGRKERDYLTISVVLLLVAFGFVVVAVNYYSQFNEPLVGRAFLVLENDGIKLKSNANISLARDVQKSVVMRLERPVNRAVFDIEKLVNIETGNVFTVVVGEEMVFAGTIYETKKIDVSDKIQENCIQYPCDVAIKFLADEDSRLLLKNLEISYQNSYNANVIRFGNDSIPIGALENGNIKDFELRNNQRVRFVLGNNEYAFGLEKISSTSAEVSILPGYAGVGLELTTPIRLDLDGNGKNDILIILTNINGNKAAFSTQHLSEEVIRKLDVNAKKTPEKKKVADEEPEVIPVKSKITRENKEANNPDDAKNNEEENRFNFLAFGVLLLLIIGAVFLVRRFLDKLEMQKKERRVWAIEKYQMEHGKLPPGVKREDYERMRENKNRSSKNKKESRKVEGLQKTAHHEVLSMFVKDLKEKNYSREQIMHELVKRGWDPREVQHVISLQEHKQVYSNIDALVAFAEEALKNGYSHTQIAKALHEKGWPKETVMKVFKEEKRLRRFIR